MNIKKFLIFSGLLIGIFLLIAVTTFFVVDELKGGAVGSGQTKMDLLVESGDTPGKLVETLSTHGMIKSSKYSFIWSVLQEVRERSNKVFTKSTMEWIPEKSFR